MSGAERTASVLNKVSTAELDLMGGASVHVGTPPPDPSSVHVGTPPPDPSSVHVGTPLIMPQILFVPSLIIRIHALIHLILFLQKKRERKCCHEKQKAY